MPAGKEKEAREAYKSLEPLARWADRDLPVFRRLETFVSRWKAEGSWTLLSQPANSAGTDETAIDRTDLKTLGPLVWALSRPKRSRKPTRPANRWNLGAHKGKNVLVIFFLGGKCPTACSSFRRSARNTRPSRN